MIENRFHCYECKTKHFRERVYKGREDAALDITNKKRKLQGCFEVSKDPKYYIDNIRYYTCIGNFFDRSVAALYDLFERYEQGVMPYPGSLIEQPAKLIEIFNIIDGIRRERIKEKQEEAKDKRHGRS